MPYKYTLLNKIVQNLLRIESAREAVFRSNPPSSAGVEISRGKFRVRSTHYSAKIEGNRLTLKEAEDVIEKGITIKGKERDVSEVSNYYNALRQVEEWAEAGTVLSEEKIKKLHAIVHKGRRARPTPYRTGQNVIRDSISGEIVYMPPEAADVPALMSEMTEWIAHAEKENVPVPIIAGVAHYQFVTIHPYYDGNGRTARLLATWIIYRGGYSLGGFFSLEESYSNDLQGYYRALRTHPHHNYYFGANVSDITPWLEYFTFSMAEVFAQSAKEFGSISSGRISKSPVDRLDSRARIVFGLFANNNEITTNAIARAVSLKERQCRNLITGWIKEGWLVIANPSKKARSYSLSEEFRHAADDSFSFSDS